MENIETETTLTDLRIHLPKLLARVQGGGEALVLTRNGKPVARLVPLSYGQGLEDSPPQGGSGAAN
jgi:prevent-host-death family protein